MNWIVLDKMLIGNITVDAPVQISWHRGDLTALLKLPVKYLGMNEVTEVTIIWKDPACYTGKQMLILIHG